MAISSLMGNTLPAKTAIATCRIARLGDGAESSSHHNAHIKLHKTARNGQKQKKTFGKAGIPKSSVGRRFPEISGISANHEKWSREKSNPRPVAQNTGETALFGGGGAEFGAQPAFPTITDPDLCRLIDAWPDLPEADRTAVVAHVAALVRLSPAMRQAILTLTRGD